MFNHHKEVEVPFCVDHQFSCFCLCWKTSKQGTAIELCEHIKVLGSKVSCDLFKYLAIPMRTLTFLTLPSIYY